MVPITLNPFYPHKSEPTIISLTPSILIKSEPTIVSSQNEGIDAPEPKHIQEVPGDWANPGGREEESSSHVCLFDASVSPYIHY